MGMHVQAPQCHRFYMRDACGHTRTQNFARHMALLQNSDPTHCDSASRMSSVATAQAAGAGVIKCACDHELGSSQPHPPSSRCTKVPHDLQEMYQLYCALRDTTTFVEFTENEEDTYQIKPAPSIATSSATTATSTTITFLNQSKMSSLNDGRPSWMSEEEARQIQEWDRELPERYTQKLGALRQLWPTNMFRDRQFMEIQDLPEYGLRPYVCGDKSLMDPSAPTTRRLYIRHSWRELATAVILSETGTFVHGSRGVGKSAWVLYFIAVLCRLAKQGYQYPYTSMSFQPNIIWRSCYFRYDYHLLFDGTVVRYPLGYYPGEQIYDRNTFIIEDDVERPTILQHPPMFSKLICIPSVSGIDARFDAKIHSLCHLRIRTMSIWTDQEMQEAAWVLKGIIDPDLYKSADDPIFKGRFKDELMSKFKLANTGWKMWERLHYERGGLIRYVLSENALTNATERIYRSQAYLTMNELERQFSACASSSPQASLALQLLIPCHLTAREPDNLDYKSWLEDDDRNFHLSGCFASGYQQRRMAAWLYQTDKKAFSSLVSFHTPISITSSPSRKRTASSATTIIPTSHDHATVAPTATDDVSQLTTSPQLTADSELGMEQRARQVRRAGDSEATSALQLATQDDPEDAYADRDREA